VAFRRQVEYLDECVPECVNLNAEEFKRVSRMIESVLPDLGVARTRVEWDAPARDLYDRRLREADNLAHELRAAFVVAGPALATYGQELAKAKLSVEHGDGAAKRLQTLMDPIIWYQTPTFHDSETLVQWEDLRERTSLMDQIAESGLQDEVDRIRVEAEHLYRVAAHAYDDALRVEQDARAQCVTEMVAASAKLPDFLADSTAARDIVKTAPGVMAEMAEAAAIDEHVRLPGQGVVPTFGVDTTNLSSTHQDVRNRAESFGGDDMTWNTADSAKWEVPVIGAKSEHDFKLEWIKNYSPVIRAAAAQYGIPAEILAGVIYLEVGGAPLWLDDATDWARQNAPLPGATSHGPLQVQVGTAATALGYDPAHLTGEQREEIINSLKDPKQNIMITAKVLADVKDATTFAYTDPADMTEDMIEENGRRLAATYRSGPNWEGGDGDEWADGFSQHFREASGALTRR
jgi:hypothetical protein